MKNSYLVIIYKGLVDKEKVKDIHKKLLDETIKQKKLGYETSDKMLKVAMNSVNALKKRTINAEFVSGYVRASYGDVNPEALLPIYFFDLIGKMKVEKKLSHEITVKCDRIEGENKEKVIKDNLEKNRSLEIPKIFYLASEHKDSASDHKDYQGKIYVDEKWRSIIANKELQEKVEKYINVHNIKTIQWVTSNPVWFITRPNCRHYFKVMNTEEVLDIPKTKLLDKYEMTTAIGNRQYLQTIKHSTSKQFYDEIRNAELILVKYKERLKLHKDMFAVSPNEILKKAINKDLMLIRKWERYIQERRKGVA